MIQVGTCYKEFLGVVYSQHYHSVDLWYRVFYV